MEEEQQQLQRVTESFAVSVVLARLTCPPWAMPTKSNDHHPCQVDRQAYEPDTHTRKYTGAHRGSSRNIYPSRLRTKIGQHHGRFAVHEWSSR